MCLRFTNFRKLVVLQRTWQLDSEESGLEKAYCCVASNARDFGRFGQLWSHNGLWNGEQLIPENLAKLAQLPRFSENPTYGNASAIANQYNGTDSQGGSSGMNVKNTKNVLSGPLH